MLYQNCKSNVNRILFLIMIMTILTCWITNSIRTSRARLLFSLKRHSIYCPKVSAYFIGAFLSLLSIPSYAKSDGLVLNNHYSTQAWLIKNVSQHVLLIDHPHPEGVAQAGWASRLNPGHYSVLLLHRKRFRLSCSLYKKVQFVSCHHALDIAPLMLVSPSKKLKTRSYWLSENQNWLKTWWRLHHDGLWRVGQTMDKHRR